MHRATPYQGRSESSGFCFVYNPEVDTFDQSSRFGVPQTPVETGLAR